MNSGKIVLYRPKFIKRCGGSPVRLNEEAYARIVDIMNATGGMYSMTGLVSQIVIQAVDSGMVEIKEYDEV